MAGPVFYNNPDAMRWLHETQRAYTGNNSPFGGGSEYEGSPEYYLPGVGDVPPTEGSGLSVDEIMPIIMALFSGDRGRANNYLDALAMSNSDARRSAGDDYSRKMNMMSALGMPF